MSHCLRKVVTYSILCCIAFSIRTQASPDSAIIPATLARQLQEYRQKDDLAGWIYQRISYTDANPIERIGFLAHTQQELWRTYKTYGERLAWFDLLALQGYYQLQSGNILSSIEGYEAALQFYESYPLPDVDIIETVLKPLGNNYTRLADYSTALYIHQKTLTLAIKNNDAVAIASVYSNMAACARWKGDLVLAVNCCKEGIAGVNKQTPVYGLLLSTYADILAEQNRYDTAVIICRQSLQQLQRYTKDTAALYWYTNALQIASRIALHQAEYSNAVKYGKSALQLFNKYFPGSRQREKAKLNVLLGDVSRQAAAATEALNYYQQALLLLLPSWKPSNLWQVPAESYFYSENTIGDALAGKAAALQLTGNKEAALAHYIASFGAEHKLRSAFFYNESKYKELQVTRLRADAAMQLAYTMWATDHDNKYLDQLLLVAELSKSQVLLDERNRRQAPGNISITEDTLFQKARHLQEVINYYQHELVQGADKKTTGILLQSAEYELGILNKKLNRQSGAGDETPLTIEQLHGLVKEIPPTISVLEFFEGADSSFMIELDATGIQSVHLITAGRQLRSDIQHFMQHWFAGGVSAMMNEPKQFYQSCYAIYTGLFSSFQWKQNQRYILVPDGIFSYLPFDALLTEPAYRADFGEWPWLFKKAPLSQAWSLQTWHKQQVTEYHTGPVTGFFVAAGRNPQLPVLSVEQEYKMLKEKVTGSWYVNASATWQQFNSSSDSASVLHIGSHAVLLAGDSFPCLQLYDKPFYLFDLRYKNFAPSLVVLGACKTAGGLLLEGEGVNSLGRGFTAAGAGGVVSGLWNVNDEATIAFTQLFYEQLQQYDPAMALQQAKQQWLLSHRNNPVLQLPYYWSGFIYSGHLQKIPLKQPMNYLWFYITGLILILASVIYLLKKKRA
jgi:CHAT domain-containing protein